ncbi:hypothetical protein NC653_013393 [Populus alba x Populus x berolinensis]|uniref:Uncharacterized protein n=1 Tax=Populus alba x Populus x berolinensis TaxID=444605 RepID=A0AAD6W2G2_9ROSI|nr:hypothetical protein NC653_013393 [Populus alba x Populus x berolinensis]
MMTLFKSQKFWDIEAQREELKVKEQKDASALYLIQQSLLIQFFQGLLEL